MVRLRSPTEGTSFGFLKGLNIFSPTSNYKFKLCICNLPTADCRLNISLPLAPCLIIPYLCLMLRPVFSYVLTSLILLSQVGLPMHYHYCKGALESVSILFSKACDDDAKALASMSECCKKFYKQHCKKENNGCCHDQVKVISQDLTSVMPGVLHLNPVAIEISNQVIQTQEIVSSTISPFSLHSIETDSGPPIYIRFHSLIYYS
jgi:hypothetical protein